MPATLYATATEANQILLAMDPDGYATGSEVTTAEVETACHDLDSYGITSRELKNADTFKVVPSALDVGQQQKLKRAVAYQVAYRRRLGPDHFIGGEYQEVSAAGMSRKGTLPMLAPAAKQLLADAGLCSAVGVSKASDANWVTVGHTPLFPWLWR